MWKTGFLSIVLISIFTSFSFENKIFALELDISNTESRKKLKIITLNDLAISDIAYIDIARSCIHKNRLHLWRVGVVHDTDKPFSRVVTKAKILPKKKAELYIMSYRSRMLDWDDFSDLVLLLHRRPDCQMFADHSRLQPPIENHIIEVISINGFTRLSDLMASYETKKPSR